MFEYVRKFESEIAEFYGSPYAVAVDSCTHAIELCLRYTQANSVQCPRHTYPSIPMTFMKLGLDWSWQDLQWNDQYKPQQILLTNMSHYIDYHEISKILPTILN